MYTDGISMMGYDACCHGDHETDIGREEDVKFALSINNLMCVYSLVNRIVRVEYHVALFFR